MQSMPVGIRVHVYTNLRDVRNFDLTRTGFIDIDWEQYSFEKHLTVVKEIKPRLTVARDIVSLVELDKILTQ